VCLVPPSPFLTREALLGSEVQLYSYLHGTSWSAAEKAALRLSVFLSLLSLTKAFAELDKEGKMIRVVQGVVTAAGACPVVHPSMILVALYRLFSVGSRLLLFPLFQELTHGLFQTTFGSARVAYGAFLLAGVDLAVQALAIWAGTKSKERLAFAVPCLVSPVDPVLHGGRPMLGAGVTFVACAHAVEAALASAVVLGHLGLSGAQTRLGEDAPFLVAFAALSLVQVPLLVLLRLRCAYEVPEGAITLSLVGDEVDRATPVALVLRCFTGNVILSDLGIDDRGAEALAEAVKASASLEWLDLSGNAIGDRGAEALAEAVKASPSLKELVLARNAIGERGAEALAEAVKASASLEQLSLNGNAIGDRGAEALAEAVKASASLKDLDMRGNRIGERGAEALRRAEDARRAAGPGGCYVEGLGEQRAAAPEGP